MMEPVQVFKKYKMGKVQVKMPKKLFLGGDPYGALDWMVNNSVTLQKYYPYNAKQSVCQMNSSWPQYKIKGQTPNFDLGGNETLLMDLLVNHGPVVVAVHANGYFQCYRQGIFDDDTCDEFPNHTVLLVG